MKVAVFGRGTQIFNSEKLHLLVESMKRAGSMELCCYSPLFDFFRKEVGDRCIVSSFSDSSTLPEDTSFLLSLGGDGTFLESLTIVRESNIPVAGINFGRLGFLTTAVVDEKNEWLDALFCGKYNVVERTLLGIDERGRGLLPADFYPVALNEITVQRSNPIMLEIEISVNGEQLPHYMADGILIGSATGSTAYSLSIGGPIVTPDSKVLIIAPIAPHNLNVRPIIVPETSVIELSYSTRSGGALLTADNRSSSLPKSARLTVSKAGYRLRSVSIGNNFMHALNQKLLWGMDKRNMLE